MFSFLNIFRRSFQVFFREINPKIRPHLAVLRGDHVDVPGWLSAKVEPMEMDSLDARLQELSG